MYNIVVFAILLLFSCFLQDVSHEDIPIMLVGNKCDLRQDGVSCVPTSYGEKLAMVTANQKHLSCHTPGRQVPA